MLLAVILPQNTTFGTTTHPLQTTKQTVFHHYFCNPSSLNNVFIELTLPLNIRAECKSPRLGGITLTQEPSIEKLKICIFFVYIYYAQPHWAPNCWVGKEVLCTGLTLCLSKSLTWWVAQILSCDMQRVCQDHNSGGWPRFQVNDCKDGIFVCSDVDYDCELKFNFFEEWRNLWVVVRLMLPWYEKVRK